MWTALDRLEAANPVCPVMADIGSWPSTMARRQAVLMWSRPTLTEQLYHCQPTMTRAAKCPAGHRQIDGCANLFARRTCESKRKRAMFFIAGRDFAAFRSQCIGPCALP